MADTSSESLDEIQMWNVDAIKAFLGTKGGLKCPGRKKELTQLLSTCILLLLLGATVNWYVSVVTGL